MPRKTKLPDHPFKGIVNVRNPNVKIISFEALNRLNASFPTRELLKGRCWRVNHDLMESLIETAYAYYYFMENSSVPRKKRYSPDRSKGEIKNPIDRYDGYFD